VFQVFLTRLSHSEIEALNVDIVYHEDVDSANLEKLQGFLMFNAEQEAGTFSHASHLLQNVLIALGVRAKE
jgi:hypothetical protein